MKNRKILVRNWVEWLNVLLVLDNVFHIEDIHTSKKGTFDSISFECDDELWKSIMLNLNLEEYIGMKKVES